MAIVRSASLISEPLSAVPAARRPVYAKLRRPRRRLSARRLPAPKIDQDGTTVVQYRFDGDCLCVAGCKPLSFR